MDSVEFDERLRRVGQVAATVKEFEDLELRAQAFRYLLGGTGGWDAPTATETALPGVAGLSEPEPQVEDNPTAVAGRTSGRRRSNGKKQTFAIDRSIDCHSAKGATGTSFPEFVDKKKPKNQIEKIVVAVYWLTRELGVEQVNVDQVYTAFKAVDWVLPADLVNAVQQAGSAMYLDSKKRDDIRLVTKGENLVEHDLPKKSANDAG